MGIVDIGDAYRITAQLLGTAGHYLGHPQTLALMNSEYLYPEVMDRSNRGDWEARGKPDIRDTARAYARRILDENWPRPMAPEIDAELRRCFDIRLPEEAMRPPG